MGHAAVPWLIRKISQPKGDRPGKAQRTSTAQGGAALRSEPVFQKRSRYDADERQFCVKLTANERCLRAFRDAAWDLALFFCVDYQTAATRRNEYNRAQSFYRLTPLNVIPVIAMSTHFTGDYVSCQNQAQEFPCTPVLIFLRLHHYPSLTLLQKPITIAFYRFGKILFRDGPQAFRIS